MNTEFFTWLNTWKETLPEKTLQELGSPESIALVSVDMVNGFCHKGSLASPVVHAIIPNVIKAFTDANNYGIKNFLLLQDTHSEHAEEFCIYPPHCIKGTEESQNIPELASLSFNHLYTTFEKNAWSPAYDTAFDAWTKSHPEVTHFILVGDCTDICVYAIAMHLRMQANANDMQRTIIVPANAVATYDMTIATAKELGALPHPAEVMHPLFLYHMALNGVTITSKLS